MSGDLKRFHEQSFSPGVGGFSAALINSFGKNIYVPKSGSLRGAWVFNEGSGLVIHDHSPYANHGIMHTAIDWVDAGLYSSGSVSGQQVEIPDDESLRLPGDMTVMIWTIPLLPISSYGGVKLAKWNGGGATLGTNEWSCTPQSGSGGGNGASFAIEVGSTIYSAVDPTSVVTGELRHVVGVRRGNLLEIWVNGDLKETTVVSGDTNTLSTNPVRMFDQGDEAGVNGNRGKGTFLSGAVYAEAIPKSIIPKIYEAGVYHGVEDLDYVV